VVLAEHPMEVRPMTTTHNDQEALAQLADAIVWRTTDPETMELAAIVRDLARLVAERTDAGATMARDPRG